MSAITVSNMSFAYDGGYDYIFENVSFVLDTNWKLGFIGRNGRGKTTFLNLLMGKYQYEGKITSNVEFDYFPYEVQNKEANAYEIAYYVYPYIEYWRMEKEISLLGMDFDVLERPFNTLSKGEQTRVLLAILFCKDNNFLLIDEPTNHLDLEARKVVASYLNKKKGFILVSHDRSFLDSCIDHVLSINKTNIEVQQGNFSSWWENKQRNDNYELNRNDKLRKDISRLEKASKQTSEWAKKVEASKFRDLTQSDNRVDKGFIGRKSAKMAQRSKNTLNRMENAIEEKSGLLKNIETAEALKVNYVPYKKNNLIDVNDLSIEYDGIEIFDKVSFSVNNGDIVQLKGSNGSGKSSIIKLLLGDNINYTGNINVSRDLKMSYVSQDTSYLKGGLKEFVKEHNLDETLFKTILRKLDFSREQFDKEITDYSEGQKKKVLIAKSLCEEANIYIWDEPLNYIDVLSRMQIEDLILNNNLTMIFVEHDETFAERVATKVVEINKKKLLKKTK